MSLPKAPSHLSPKTRRWFRSVAHVYELDDASDKLLIAAAECLDRASAARDMITKDGLTYRDRFGAPRKHPAVGIENDAMRTFAQLMKCLGLPETDAPASLPGTRIHRRSAL